MVEQKGQFWMHTLFSAFPNRTSRLCVSGKALKTGKAGSLLTLAPTHYLAFTLAVQKNGPKEQMSYTRSDRVKSSEDLVVSINRVLAQKCSESQALPQHLVEF